MFERVQYTRVIASDLVQGKSFRVCVLSFALLVEAHTIHSNVHHRNQAQLTYMAIYTYCTERKIIITVVKYCSSDIKQNDEDEENLNNLQMHKIVYP